MGGWIQSLPVALSPFSPSRSLGQDVLPARAEVDVMKLANRTLLYGIHEGNPICFDPEGRGEVLVPSIYVLFAAPRALPRLLTYSEVSPKLLGGADMMLPGVIVPPAGLGDFKKGDLRAVAVPGNPVPFAVGVMEVDAAEVAANGMKGRGLRVLHACEPSRAGGGRAIPWLACLLACFVSRPPSGKGSFFARGCPSRARPLRRAGGPKLSPASEALFFCLPWPAPPLSPLLSLSLSLPSPLASRGLFVGLRGQEHARGIHHRPHLLDRRGGIAGEYWGKKSYGNMEKK